MASIAGLPATKARVGVGPPLLASVVLRILTRAMGSIAVGGGCDVVRAGCEVMKGLTIDQTTVTEEVEAGSGNRTIVV
jgi:hypothetical protein